ncbi:MAG TPA: hypothetical protein VGC32_13635 [Solirubrobacterales bacterium]
MLAALWAATPASAAPAWLPATQLTGPFPFTNSLEVIAVDSDPAGDALAAWPQADGADQTLMVAFRPAGGGWGPPVAISTPGRKAGWPAVAFDAAGEATAVWMREDSPFPLRVHGVIQAADLPAGGTWGAPVDLSAASVNAVGPRLAVDRGGDAAVVWEGGVGVDGTEGVIQATTRPAGGGWSAPADLADVLGSASVAIDEAGIATAVWSASSAPPSSGIQAASGPVGGTWSPPADVTQPGSEETQTGHRGRCRR